VQVPSHLGGLAAAGRAVEAVDLDEVVGDADRVNHREQPFVPPHRQHRLRRAGVGDAAQDQLGVCRERDVRDPAGVPVVEELVEELPVLARAAGPIIDS
jgi:hypothetical protein